MLQWLSFILILILFFAWLYEFRKRIKLEKQKAGLIYANKNLKRSLIMEMRHDD